MEGSPDIGNRKYLIGLREDGRPHLPDFDLDHVATDDVRYMLKTYIEFIWSGYLTLGQLLYLPWKCADFAANRSVVQQKVAVPWDLLDTAALRRKFLVNPKSFSHVKTLDPMRMTPRDVYNILDLLLKDQSSGVQTLAFSIRNSFDSHANQRDDDNSELPDPLTPLKPHASSIGDLGIDNVITEMDNDISGLHDPFTEKRTFDTANTERHPASPRKEGVRELKNNAMAEIISDHSERYCNPHLQNSLPLSSTPAATSLVVGLPFESPPPSSESMVEVAIRNVARAGYLSITHDAVNPDQTSSQLEGVNSKPKKRTQEEMEQEDSGKKMKKRAKIAVPAREQSLRYGRCHYLAHIALLMLLELVSKIPITRTRV